MIVGPDGDKAANSKGKLPDSFFKYVSNFEEPEVCIKMFFFRKTLILSLEKSPMLPSRSLCQDQEQHIQFISDQNRPEVLHQFTQLGWVSVLKSFIFSLDLW